MEIKIAVIPVVSVRVRNNGYTFVSQNPVSTYGRQTFTVSIREVLNADLKELEAASVSNPVNLVLPALAVPGLNAVTPVTLKIEGVKI